MSARDAQLDLIRRTYSDYERSGRTRLWDRSNPGMVRVSHEAQTAIVRLIAASMPADGSEVLDLGCGDGSLAGVVRGSRVISNWTGVDLRPEAVADAAATHRWARFVEASADDLPFCAARFDVVVTAVLFSSFPSEELEVAVAEEIRRVLRPGGWLIWYDLRYDNPANAAVHGVTRRRLAQLFAGWHTELRLHTLLPPLARRLGPLTPFAYPALDALPPLRSHLVGRLQRPA